jgi:hypothetical protein
VAILRDRRNAAERLAELRRIAREQVADMFLASVGPAITFII